MYFLSELDFSFRRELLGVEVAFCLGGTVDLYFMRQKNDRRAPAQRPDTFCALSALTAKPTKNPTKYIEIEPRFNEKLSISYVRF